MREEVLESDEEIFDETVFLQEANMSPSAGDYV